MTMTTKRRTTREPDVDPSSPFAPVVEAGRAMVRTLMGTAPADDDAQNIVIAKVEGIESMILLCQRAGAGEVVFERGQRLVKVKRGSVELDDHLSLEERVRRLEDDARRAKREPRALTLISTPKPPPVTVFQRAATKGARRLLIAIAQSGMAGATQAKLAVLTGYKATSRRTYLGELIANAYAIRTEDRFVATSKGMEWLGGDYKPLPVGAELRRHLIDSLPPGETKLLAVLVDRFPEIVSREELSRVTGYKATSIRTYAAALATREVATSSREGLAASPLLFDDGGKR